jgi:hypothetical protein
MAGYSLAAIFGPLLVMVPISPSGSAAPTTFTCKGTVSHLSPQDIPAGTYSSLVMPSGSLCGIVADVTVTGGLTVGAGAGLAVASGDLHVEGPGRVGPGGSFGDFYNAAPITIDGTLWVDHNATVGIGLEAPHLRPISFITGAVRANDPSSIQIHNTKVSGPVDIRGGGGPNPIFAAAGIPYSSYAFNVLDDNVILGAVRETGYDGTSSRVVRNVMAGFTFANNNVTAGLTFANNSELPSSRNTTWDRT